jgi:glycosyltransferase involved in cell wall biosynthesis
LLSPQSSVLSPSSPRVSFVISTHNRRDVLLGTLAELQRHAAEILVVDNASADGAADAVRERFPGVRLFPLNENRGPCAKNVAISQASGEFIVFLDDDSFPLGDSIPRMIEKFTAYPRLGAVVFAVDLPGGASECSAYPQVFAGCGAGFRKAALDQVGGLPDDFFMAAEEYDLSLRLLDGGWEIQRFEDLRVRHLKTPGSRYPGRIMRLDVCNNLTLIGRYFPDEWVIPFAADWARRYRLLALANGRLTQYYAGLAQGMARLAAAHDRRPVSESVFEQFAKVEETAQKMAEETRAHHWKRILLIDLGKNILPYWRAAERCGIEVTAIADAKLGGRGFTYRGVKVVADEEATALRFDGAVVSNLSPVHARQRHEFWAARTDRPVVDLFAAA